jgi:hypothetical protein
MSLLCFLALRSYKSVINSVSVLSYILFSTGRYLYFSSYFFVPFT